MLWAVVFAGWLVVLVATGLLAFVDLPVGRISEWLIASMMLPMYLAIGVVVIAPMRIWQRRVVRALRDGDLPPSDDPRLIDVATLLIFPPMLMIIVSLDILQPMGLFLAFFASITAPWMLIRHPTYALFDLLTMPLVVDRASDTGAVRIPSLGWAHHRLKRAARTDAVGTSELYERAWSARRTISDVIVLEGWARALLREGEIDRAHHLVDLLLRAFPDATAGPLLMARTTTDPGERSAWLDVAERHHARAIIAPADHAREIASLRQDLAD